MSADETLYPAAASNAVLPAGEPSDLPPPPSSDPATESSDHAAGGARVAARCDGLSEYLATLCGDMSKLMRNSESVGYERGYLACLSEIVEHVTGGLKVDGDLLTAMLYRPVLCRFCKNPLSKTERVMDNVCADCAKRFGGIER